MNAKPKRKHESRLVIVTNRIKQIFTSVLLLCVLGLCSLITALMLFSSLNFTSWWRAENRIEENLQFELPVNSENVLFYQRWSDETKVRFQFSAPPEEITVWLEHPNLCFETPLNGDNVEAHGWHYYDWWNPSSVTAVVTGTCRTDRNRLKHISQQILIDQTQSDYWIVYFIIWYM